MKEIMSGNEAIARGAFECGATFAAGYPGTPSTEIMEQYSRYRGVYAEWSPNEKVALEVAIGAALGGARSMAVMKHVGVNVAADPLFTVSYTGTNGALVVITADDPSLHSSQNEQDNRHYADFAKIPMLEPSDSQEAKEFIKRAFEISELFDTPVFLRTTTRVSHSKSVVILEEPVQVSRKLIERLEPAKYVMVPFNARMRRVVVHERLQKLREFAETMTENMMEINDRRIGIITSGMPYNYAKDVLPDYSYLKLGMVYPLPEKLIRSFAARVRKLYVIEELDPFIEERVKAMGIKVIGKEIFPYRNEFDPGVIEEAIRKRPAKKISLPPVEIPQRPPNLCPGCPHRGLFYILGKSKTIVTGDIGCYTLSFMKPLEGLQSCICMGASIGMAHGLSKTAGAEMKGKIVGVLGDSTFIHSGITSLLNTAYNRSDVVIIIADNSTTAMTGMQQHPATGVTLQGERTTTLNFEVLAKAMGIENVRAINPYDMKNTRTVLREELAKPGPSLVISQGPCVLLTRAGMKSKPFKVIDNKCVGCKACLGLGCPAISWKKLSADSERTVPGKSKKLEGVAVIDTSLCTGCTLCEQLCNAEAIVEEV
jgi:indolepyruvate ferredoxin oxidoreductase alpha subunit